MSYSTEPTPKKFYSYYGLWVTPRQDEIIGLIQQGYSNNEIAEELGIKLRTVKTHIYNIYSSPVLRQLDINNRSKLILYMYNRRRQKRDN
jgi:DNA-binding NarL/FixJ family response regulator